MIDIKLQFYNYLNRLLLAICLLLFTATALQAQPANTLQFAKQANLPYRLIYAAYTHDEHYFYAINGLANSTFYSTEVLRYDPAANKWQVLTNKLNAKINAVAAYVPSVHKIYVMGGSLADRRGFFYKVECVDVQTGSVTTLKVQNPAGGVNCGIAVWNNKIYVMGGFSEIGYPSRELYEFDPATETFKKLALMPVWGNVSAAIINGVMYTFGGRDVTDNNTFKNVYAYNIATNTYTLAGKLSHEIRATAISQWSRNIFLTGDEIHNNLIGCFDTDTHQFKELKSNMLGRRYAGAGVINGMLYVYGGGLSLSDPGMASVQATDISRVSTQ